LLALGLIVTAVVVLALVRGLVWLAVMLFFGWMALGFVIFRRRSRRVR